ncbi:MAG: MG2 domain-containing protein [Endomicrobia bacterium]|nr:MG2 domain-containing protein [Endomicrobiia bacterium]
METPEKETKKSSVASKFFKVHLRFSISLIFIAVMLFVGLIFYNSKKVPLSPDAAQDTYSFNAGVTAPPISNVSVDKDGNTSVEKPGNVTIQFNSSSYGAPSPLNKEYVADQDKLNTLITITPELRGKWSVSEFALYFTPEKEWTAAQKYKVKLDKALFNSNIKVDKDELEFTTAPNDVFIENLTVAPSKQKGQLTLNTLAQFNYPVDREAAKKGVKLTIDKKSISPKISFDQYNRIMFLNFEPVTPKSKPQNVNLGIKFDSMSAQKSMQIDSSEKFFNIKRVEIIPPSKIGANYCLSVESTDIINPENLLSNSKIKAWALPYEGGKNWQNVSMKDVRVALKDAKALNLAAIPGNSINPFFEITNDIDSTDYEYDIYVLFDQGAESEGGFSTNEKKEFVVHMEKLPKRLQILGSGSIIPLSSEHILNFASQGLHSVEIKVSRILPERVNHLVSQISDPYFGSKSRPRSYDDGEDEDIYKYVTSDQLNESETVTIFNRMIHLADTGIKPNFFTLDLKGYFKRGELGIFLVDATSYGVSQKRLITITDIGLIYKKEADGKLKLFALSIVDQLPLSGAKVELLSRNGTVLKTEYTGSDGIAAFEVPSSLGAERKPVAFVVSKGSDYAFMPFDKREREVSFSRFDTAGAGYLQNSSLDAFIFTDRGIYRPGDTVNFAIISKNMNWTSTAGLPVKVSVTDARDKNIFEKTVSLTAEGFKDFSLQTTASSPTGEYKISVYDESGKYISGGTFNVAEFKEDKLKINTSIEGASRKGWQPVTGLTGKVTVKNMFGTPAVGNTVSMKMQLRPEKFKFAQYKDYSFSDVISSKANLRFEELTFGDNTTSKEGLVTTELDLSSFEKGTYSLTFWAEAFEQESGHSVTAMSTRLVSPNKYIVGYQTDADLSYMQHNSKKTINFIAIDPDLNQIEPGPFKIRILNQQYVSVPVRNRNSFRYQSVLNESLFSIEDFNIKKDGSAFTMPTKNPGNYALEMVNKEGEIVMRLEFFVSGSANVAYDLERNIELRLNLEKDTIEQGGVLNLNITAPFTGTGLITIEKDKVYAHKWFKTTTNSSEQSIKIPEELTSGAYVNVSFLRSMDSKELFASPYSYAVTHFNIKPVKHMSEITLGTPELVKPGDRIDISYKTSAPSKIIIYGVNEGILQVAKYKVPDPIAYFFRKSALGVITYQMWDLIMPDNKLIKEVYGIGGDYEAASALLEAGLNPFARKTEKPVVFWSGILEASPNANVYSYDVPDYFNGQIRIMAVAASQNTVSSADKEVLVRAPLMLSAGGPVAAAPGDTFNIGVRVSNNKEGTKDGKVIVNINVSDNLSVIGAKNQSVNVPYGQEKTVYFKVQAGNTLGNATISFDAELANPKETASRKITLSVRPASAMRVTINNGIIRGSTKIKDFDSRELYDQFSKNTIALSVNPLVVAGGLGAFLEKFPHGCTEQITSQIFPTIVFYKASGNEGGAKESLARVIEMLKVRQLSNGGFSLWDGGSYVSEYPSLYAFHMLTEASEMGYNVPKDIKDKALSWVKEYAERNSFNGGDISNTAYAHYLIAKNGVVMTNALMNFEEWLNKNNPNWKETVTGVYVAAAYKLLKNDAKALSIIKEYKAETSAYRYYYDYDSSFSRNAKYIYIVGLYFPELMKEKKASEIIKSLLDDINAKRYNTMTSATGMLALYSYSKINTVKDSDIEVRANGQKLTFAKNSLGMLEASFGHGVKEFDVKVKDDSANIYYVITQQGFDKGEVKPAANGMRIERSYSNIGSIEYDGSMGDDLAVALGRTSLPNNKDNKRKDKDKNKGILGDEMDVTIETRSLGGTITNVAITDILPGGFTVVPGSINSSGGFTLDYFDIREDRLLLYGTVNSYDGKINYKVKFTSEGTFKVPAITAAPLYDTSISAAGAESTFVIESRN